MTNPINEIVCVNNLTTLFGRGTAHIVRMVAEGDRAGVMAVIQDVYDTMDAGGYTHSPGLDDQLVEDIQMLWGLVYDMPL